MQISGALTSQHGVHSQSAQRGPLAASGSLRRRQKNSFVMAAAEQETEAAVKPDGTKQQIGFRRATSTSRPAQPITRPEARVFTLYFFIVLLGSRLVKRGTDAIGLRSQRWQTDKRVGAQVWDNVPMMETKSGGNYVIWPVVWQALTNAGLDSVDVEEAKKLVAGGARFVDIRTPDNYAAEHIPNAASVPLFVPVEGTETFDRIKKFVMATAFAMQATERNTRFVEAAERSLPNKQEQIIVYCNRGGRLETGKKGRRGKYDDKDLSFGIESRSLKGCYELMQAGYTNVVHLKGGISTWRFTKNPTVKS